MKLLPIYLYIDQSMYLRNHNIQLEIFHLFDAAMSVECGQGHSSGTNGSSVMNITIMQNGHYVLFTVSKKIAMLQFLQHQASWLCIYIYSHFLCQSESLLPLFLSTIHAQLSSSTHKYCQSSRDLPCHSSVHPPDSEAPHSLLPAE